MRMPAWIHYGGRAWLPDAGVEVIIPRRVYPVVDIVSDNYGDGIVVWTGSVDAVFDPEYLTLATRVGECKIGPEIEVK